MKFTIVGALIHREFQSSFINSPGGYFWSIVEPIAGLAIITFVFSMSLSVPPLGNSFSIYYATGMIPFLMFMDVSNKVAQSLGFSHSFLELPTVLLIDAIIARFLFNSFTQILVGIIIFTGLFYFLDIWPEINMLRILIGYLVLMLFSLSVGTANIFLFNFFPLWQRLWAIATRPLFLISGILFLPENTPEPHATIFWYNPISHIVHVIRTGFYSNYPLNEPALGYVLLLTAVILLIGTLFLTSRFHERFAH